MAGMPKPTYDDSEDQVQRTPRARRTLAAKRVMISKGDPGDYEDGVVRDTRRATADDMEADDIRDVQKGLVKPRKFTE